jgi:hypothetical protein
MHAMDIYRQKTCPPAPFVMPPAPTGGGTIIGYVMGTDTIIPGHPNANPGPAGDLVRPVCYGTVVRTGSNEVVVAIRGTDGFAEWVEDGQFPPVPYRPAKPLPLDKSDAYVEQGFWGIYQSLQLADIHGAIVGTLADELPAILGSNDDLIIAGHSLGAPLATYLTVDLARADPTRGVSGCYFASPHPGNQAFASLFDSIVGSNYVVYNYLLDIVPRVPPTELGYCSLSGRRVITPDDAQADVRVDVGCNHHIVCYLAMLDYEATKKALDPMPPGEADSASCIRGKLTPDEPSLARSLVTRIVEVAGKNV